MVSDSCCSCWRKSGGLRLMARRRRCAAALLKSSTKKANCEPASKYIRQIPRSGCLTGRRDIGKLSVDWFDTLSERDRLLATSQYWASVLRIRLTLLGVARQQPRFDDAEL